MRTCTELLKNSSVLQSIKNMNYDIKVRLHKKRGRGCSSVLQFGMGGWQQGQVHGFVPEPEYTVRGVTLNRRGCSSPFTLSTRRQRGKHSLASPLAALTTRGSFDGQYVLTQRDDGTVPHLTSHNFTA